jgi:hypothetical protein
MNVILLPRVLEYLENLVFILFEKEYFCFLETAQKYVDDLLGDIITSLPKRPSKPAPQYFDKYGKNMEYVTFKKNKHTTWYVFFRVYRKNEELRINISSALHSE